MISGMGRNLGLLVGNSSRSGPVPRFKVPEAGGLKLNAVVSEGSLQLEVFIICLSSRVGDTLPSLSSALKKMNVGPTCSGI